MALKISMPMSGEPRPRRRGRMHPVRGMCLPHYSYVLASTIMRARVGTVMADPEVPRRPAGHPLVPAEESTKALWCKILRTVHTNSKFKVGPNCPCCWLVQWGAPPPGFMSTTTIHPTPTQKKETRPQVGSTPLVSIRFMSTNVHHHHHHQHQHHAPPMF